MSNPYLSWERRHCVEPEDFKYMYDRFLEDKPEIIGADTESTGLHIKKDIPFLIILGWEGKVFTFEPNPQRMNLFFKMAKMAKMFVWWHTKYDLHMLSNLGYEKQVQELSNLCEGMALARLSLEAVPAREGGDSLQLKDIGVKYVHHLANEAEKHIKTIMKSITNERVKVLASALKQFDTGEISDKGKPKKWEKGAVEKFLKDPTNDIEDLPEEVREVWVEWSDTLGQEVTYKDIYERDPEAMIRYAGDDVITMLEFVKKSLPIVRDREQLSVLERENNVILPLFRMERAGLKVNREYLKESRLKVKNYIIQQRSKLYALVGEKVTCNQHARIKQIFLDKWDIKLEGADNAAMKFVKKTYEGEPVEFANLISQLRTLEKWYSTYILRILENTKYDGYFYTQIAQCSAVSGRVGSDSQQFPKGAIYTLEKEELYHPRKAFIVPGGYKWYFLDFSQIELRKQANYTILVSGGDESLCRAYMPFRCTHYLTNEEYNYQDVAQRKRWNELKPGHPDPKDFKEGIADVFALGWSVWQLEDGTPWQPTDVHGQTTHKAFPHIPLGSPEFKEWRNKGKMFNFMRNYGGGKGAAMKSLDLTEEHADALVNGYSEAFPHVLIYQNQVIKQHRKQGYVTNMYGRRYYLNNPNKGYKLANYLIQGTCSDELKECIIEIDIFLQDKQSKFVMTVHDELSFYVKQGEEWIVPILREMMEKQDWCLVPVVSDVEVTTTNWKEKVNV